MNKLDALIEAAKAQKKVVEAYPHHNYSMNVDPTTILELCALLEKAEEALNVAAMHCNGDPWVVIHKALAAIKQWKEQT